MLKLACSRRLVRNLFTMIHCHHVFLKKTILLRYLNSCLPPLLYKGGYDYIIVYMAFKHIAPLNSEVIVNIQNTCIII